MKKSMKLTGSRCKIEIERVDNILTLQFLNNNEDYELMFSFINSHHIESLNTIITNLKIYLQGTKEKQDLYQEIPILNDNFTISYHMTKKSFPYINLSIIKIIKPDGVKHLNFKKHKIITDLKITNKELKSFFKILTKMTLDEYGGGL
jgi:hypothetical protein